MSQDISAQPALLVVDVQEGLFSGKPPPFKASEVVNKINEVITKARSAGVPVIFVQHDGRPEENVLPGTHGWKLHSALEVQHGDRIIRKTTCDAFYKTSLESELRRAGIDTVMLAGFATDFCIDSTLRNAVSKEFSVLVIADAHTTNDGPAWKAEQIIAHHNYAWANCTTSKPVKVLKAEEVSFKMRSASDSTGTVPMI